MLTCQKLVDAGRGDVPLILGIVKHAAQEAGRAVIIVVAVLAGIILAAVLTRALG